VFLAGVMLSPESLQVAKRVMRTVSNYAPERGVHGAIMCNTEAEGASEV
jgi:hypothetical protein